MKKIILSMSLVLLMAGMALAADTYPPWKIRMETDGKILARDRGHATDGIIDVYVRETGHIEMTINGKTKLLIWDNGAVQIVGPSVPAHSPVIFYIP